MSKKEEAIESEILEQLKSFIPKSFELVEKNLPDEDHRYKGAYRLGVLEASIESLIDQIEIGLVRINANKRLIKN